MKIYERIFALVLVLAMSVLLCSCAATEGVNSAPMVEEAAVTAEPQPETEAQPVVEDIKLMYYTTELEGDLMAMVGERIELWAEPVSASEGLSVEWESSNEASLRLKEAGPNAVVAEVLSTEKSPVMLTVSCGDFKKVYPVYIKPDQNGREAVAPGDIRLMFYTTELSEFTLRVGETVQLYAEIDGVDDAQFEWKSSDESSLKIEHKTEDKRDACITAEKAVMGGVTLTISCGGVEEDFKVYIVE